MAKNIGSDALIPNPALHEFSALVGEWTTTGTHPHLPGTIFHGRTSFQWHEGGAFMVMHSEIDEPGIPSGIAIFGSDNETRKYFMIYFDERGISRKYDVTMNDNILEWQRVDTKISQLFTIAIGGDGHKMTGKGEMSRDGKPWEPDLNLTYTR